MAEPDEEQKFVLVYDPKLRRPGCVILQAAMGGTLPDFNDIFDSETWLINITPDLRPYRVTKEQAKRIAELSVKR